MATARTRAVDLSTASAPPTMARNRGRATAALVGKASTAMLTLAETAYRENAKMNGAKRDGDKAKKELNILMVQTDLKQFDFTVDAVPCEAIIEATIGNAVDVKALRKLIPEEQFMRIVAATQANVEAEVGKNILMKCMVETTGEPSLKVRKKK